MTLKKARERVGYWKRRFNLQEWSIRVKVRPDAEMPDNLGTVTWFVEDAKPIATMELRETAEEETLVHELLHLVIQGHAPYEEYDPHQERAINRIAAVLCNQN